MYVSNIRQRRNAHLILCDQLGHDLNKEETHGPEDCGAGPPHCTRNIDCFVAMSSLMQQPQQVRAGWSSHCDVVHWEGRVGTCSQAKREPNALENVS